MVTFVKENQKRKDSQQIWAITRSILEANNIKYKKNGKKSKSRWTQFEKLLNIFNFFLKLTPYYEKGVNQARDIQLNKLQLNFPNLPLAFDGFKILHLSDLHIDALPELEDNIINRINEVDCDLCILTGDYRKNTSGAYKHINAPMKKLLNAINSKHGIFAVLGNHDTYLMKEFEESMPVKFLINESIEIEQENDKILLTGTDDPFAYYTDQAIASFDAEYQGFKIAAVHTPELKNIASDYGYQLYLCGHTHGGQICLPGGIPLITHQKEGTQFASGLWQINGMTGYTSNGCGVSGIPVRFNSFGEISLIELHKNSNYENN